jgi:glycosyltransferase involved in cell wall biosynthesis
VIVPSFNEAELIESTFNTIVEALDDPDRCEIVLVDDGSTDATASIMRSIRSTAEIPVVVVERECNGGMGQALASGFEAATGRLLTWIPGDGEYEIGEILVGVEALEASDIVLVRRSTRNQASRNFVSSVMYGLIRALFRFDARGYCGIFIVRTDRWRSLGVQSRDVFFTLETAIRAAHRRWRIGYIDAAWHPRRAGRSKVFKPSTVLRNVGELFRFRWALWMESAKTSDTADIAPR